MAKQVDVVAIPSINAEGEPDQTPGFKVIGRDTDEAVEEAQVAKEAADDAAARDEAQLQDERPELEGRDDAPVEPSDAAPEPTAAEEEAAEDVADNEAFGSKRSEKRTAPRRRGR